MVGGPPAGWPIEHVSRAETSFAESAPGFRSNDEPKKVSMYDVFTFSGTLVETLRMVK